MACGWQEIFLKNSKIYLKMKFKFTDFIRGRSAANQILTDGLADSIIGKNALYSNSCNRRGLREFPQMEMSAMVTQILEAAKQQ